MKSADARKSLRKLANKKKAKVLQGFFKTGPGDYGQGDIFIGVNVPQIRKLVKDYQGLNQREVMTLLHSGVHEERLLALLILVRQFESGEDEEKGKIYHFYLKNSKFVNNWDLVDLTAHQIVGAYLEGRDKSLLLRLARSNELWEKRIAIVSTFQYIYAGKHEWTFKISEILLHDTHDLIHKAVGWMLREVGKRCSEEILETFLKKHYRSMPRTMLRYAIERFPEKKRKEYLSKY